MKRNRRSFPDEPSEKLQLKVLKLLINKLVDFILSPDSIRDFKF